MHPDRLGAAARAMAETANRWNTRLRAIKQIVEDVPSSGTTGHAGPAPERIPR